MTDTEVKSVRSETSMYNKETAKRVLNALIDYLKIRLKEFG